MINAGLINQNELLDAYISEFDKNYEIIRNIKVKKLILLIKNGLLKMLKFIFKIIKK